MSCVTNAQLEQKTKDQVCFYMNEFKHFQQLGQFRGSPVYLQVGQYHSVIYDLFNVGL